MMMAKLKITAVILLLAGAAMPTADAFSLVCAGINISCRHCQQVDPDHIYCPGTGGTYGCAKMDQ